MRSLLKYECVRHLYEEFDRVNSTVYASAKLDHKNSKKTNRIYMNKMIQKEDLKKKIKQRSSNRLSMRRDTSISIKKSAKRVGKRRSRYKTITVSPVNQSQNDSTRGKGFNDSTICGTSGRNNLWQRQRINSYCISPTTTLSIDHDASHIIHRPTIRYSNAVSIEPPLHETLENLKSKIRNKHSYTGSTRHRSNKRSTYGVSTVDSKPTNFTSSEHPLATKDYTNFKIGFSRRKAQKYLKPSINHRFSVQPPQPVKAIRLSYLS
ncbi:unnamed protein product [Moneuplotes crassus]|uniref:Uncharacterized protein n=1 Tax=Euplotes crassus TaxID=5936 RepID=A0AAD1URG6_EUPCR|nr:unnamed protein product [Moneuplotes crassus]